MYMGVVSMNVKLWRYSYWYCSPYLLSAASDNFSTGIHSPFSYGVRYAQVLKISFRLHLWAFNQNTNKHRHEL